MVDKKFINIINSMTPKENPMMWFDEIKQSPDTISKALNSTPRSRIASDVGKGVMRYAPITGDLIDIGAGVRSISQGHPWIGTGQLGIGTLGLIGSLATLPAGGIGSTVAKTGAKALARRAYRALPNIVKQGVVKAPIKRQVGVAGLELMKSGNNKNTNEQPIIEQPQSNPLPPIEDINIDPASIEPFPNIAQGASGYVAPLPPLPDVQYSDYIVDATPEYPQWQQVGLGDISKLLEIYGGEINKINKPYIEALQNYLDNYSNYIGDSEKRKRFYAGLAGLSRNNNYAGIANDYNPVDIEANKLNLLNQLLQTKYSNFNAINNLLGNATIAQQLGLPAEASLADKNLLNAYTSQQRALYGLEGKKYSSDLGYKGKIEEAYIDNATRRAIEQGKIENAIKLQELKNSGIITGKTIDASAYGIYNPAEIDRLIRQYSGGNIPRGLDYRGLPIANQQTTINNLDAILQGRK